MTTPHDTLFHAVFGQPRHAGGWLQCQLPIAIAQWVVWPSLRPAPERLDGLDLRLHVADVVHLGELTTGLTIGFLLEHSSALIRALRQKLLRYGVHLGRTGRVLVCVVLYHGKRPWRDFAARDPRWAGLGEASAQALAGLQARLEFVLDDLARCSEPELRQRPFLTPLARLTLLCLRFLRGFAVAESLAAVGRWGDLLQAVDRDPEDGPDAVEQIACYFLRTTEIPPKELHAAFERVLQRPEDTIMSTAQRLLKEGEARGAALGEARGVARKLLGLLERRFGPLPEPVVLRVQGASLPDLDRWFDRILDAKTRDEVFG